jgi:hypothetical protein
MLLVIHSWRRRSEVEGQCYLHSRERDRDMTRGREMKRERERERGGGEGRRSDIPKDKTLYQQTSDLSAQFSSAIPKRPF